MNLHLCRTCEHVIVRTNTFVSMYEEYSIMLSCPCLCRFLFKSLQHSQGQVFEQQIFKQCLNSQAVKKNFFYIHIQTYKHTHTLTSKQKYFACTASMFEHAWLDIVLQFLIKQNNHHSARILFHVMSLCLFLTAVIFVLFVLSSHLCRPFVHSLVRLFVVLCCCYCCSNKTLLKCVGYILVWSLCLFQYVFVCENNCWFIMVFTITFAVVI